MKSSRFCLCVMFLLWWGVAASFAQNSSPDLPKLSGKLVFQSENDGDWEIYAINADGTHLIQLTQNQFADEQPCWSPDGEHIAFTSNRTGTYEIYTMKTDGTDVRRLTHQGVDAKEPAWSPDGTQILFTGYSRSQPEFHLYLMNSDGTNVHQIVLIQRESKEARWSPDGQTIAFSATRYNLDWGIHILDVRQDQLIRLTGSGATQPAWSPDGSRMAYILERPYAPLDLMVQNITERSDIRAISSDRDKVQHPTWSPDGQYLLYAQTPDRRDPNWQLQIVDVARNQPVNISSYPIQGIWPDWIAGTISDALFKRKGVPWSLRYIYEAEYAPRSTGKPRQDLDAFNERAVLAYTAYEPGFMAYGPSEDFPPGDYQMTFRLKADDYATPKTPLVRIDVATEKGTIILTERTLYGSDFLKKNRYQPFDLTFSLTQTQELEFRVFFFAKATAWLDHLILAATLRDPQDPNE